MSDAVAGVVLAAGLSSRMGTNKMFLELGGKTVLCRAVETAIAAKLSPLLVVLGNERQRAEHELHGLACTPLFNPDFASGINTSLRAGISALPDNVAGALVMLADMPFVTAPMIDELLQKWRAGSSPLAVSLYGDVLAPPMLYGRDLFAELRALEGDGCGKRVVKRHRAEALEVSWPAAALTDLDVPGDFARVRAQIEGA